MVPDAESPHPPSRNGPSPGWLMGRARSVRYAVRGIRVLVVTQPNARIHALATACVILMAAYLRLGPRDWAALVLAIAVVWAAEALNTALEALADAAVPAQHPLVARAKDAAAAGVLLAALASVLVGLLIMGPPLVARISGFFTGAG